MQEKFELPFQLNDLLSVAPNYSKLTSALQQQVHLFHMELRPLPSVHMLIVGTDKLGYALK